MQKKAHVSTAKSGGNKRVIYFYLATYSGKKRKKGQPPLRRTEHGRAKCCSALHSPESTPRLRSPNQQHHCYLLYLYSIMVQNSQQCKICLL